MHKKSGIFQLELALATAVIVAFFLAAVNITNIYRSKAAAIQGVKSALRCLTPVEAECRVELESAKYNETRLFDIYEILPEGSPVKQISTYNYDILLSGQLVTIPEFEISNLTAKVLESVVVPAGSYKAVMEEFEASATGNYLIRELPSVRFRDPSNKNAGYVIHAGSRINGELQQWPDQRVITNRLTGQRVEGLSRKVVPVTIPASVYSSINPSLPCFHQEEFSENGYLQSCDSFKEFTGARTSGITLPEQLTRSTYGVLAIEGRAIRGSGNIALSIRWTDESGEVQERDLGGQSIQESQSGAQADFIPRGAPLANYQNIDDYQEPALHQAIRLPIGRNFQLIFQGDTQGIEYEIQKISFYLPEYTAFSENGRCLNWLDRSELNSDNCNIKLANYANEISATGLTVINTRIAAEKEFSCYDTRSAAEMDFQRWQRDFDPLGLYYFSNDSTQCRLKALQQQCRTNFGISDASKSNFDMIIASCNPDAKTARAVSTDKLNTYLEKTIELGSGNNKIPVPNRLCLNPCHESRTLPSPYNQYRNLNYHCGASGNFSYRQVIQGEILNFRMEDPFNFVHVENDPAGIEADDNVCYYQGIFNQPASTVFKGLELFQNPAPDLGCKWESKLISELYRAGLSDLYKTFYSALPIRNDTGQKIAIQHEVDSCTPFQVINNGARSELLHSRNIPEEEIASICSQLNGPCKTVVSKIISNNSKAGSDSAYFEPARNRLVATIKKLIPLAADRFRISNVEINETAGKTGFHASTEIDVPLFLSGGSIKVSYSESALKEGL